MAKKKKKKKKKLAKKKKKIGRINFWKPFLSQIKILGKKTTAWILIHLCFIQMSSFKSYGHEQKTNKNKNKNKNKATHTSFQDFSICRKEMRHLSFIASRPKTSSKIFCPQGILQILSAGVAPPSVLLHYFKKA